MTSTERCTQARLAAEAAGRVYAYALGAFRSEEVEVLRAATAPKRLAARVRAYTSEVRAIRARLTSEALDREAVEARRYCAGCH